MSKMPTFSIIIPVYNVAPYLRECLDSVLAQTFSDWEAICVDDGSTDGSGAILDEYASKDSRFRVIHQQNAGVCAARNLGLSKVTGEWLLFLDSDDVFRDCALKVLSQAIHNNRECSFIVFDKESFAAAQWLPSPISAKPIPEMRDVSKNVVVGPYDRYFWQCAYRRDRYGDLRFNPEIKYNMGEDVLYSVEANERTDMELILPVALYGYRLRVGSAMRSPMTAQKFKNNLRHSSLVLDRIAGSRKVYAPKLLRAIGLSLTEGMTNRMWNMRKEDRRDAWIDLFDLHRQICRNWTMPIWVRFVSFLTSATCSRLVFYVLCGIPFELKKRGLHRRR